MILSDGTNTFTEAAEDIREEIVRNGSSVLTLGGQVKAQADSQRLKIESKIRVPASRWDALNRILVNFDSSLTYTPSRVLATKSSIEAFGVILAGDPKIDQRVWNGEIVYWVVLTFEEVLF